MQRHGKAVEPFLKEGEDPQGFKVFTPEEDGERSKELDKAQDKDKEGVKGGPSSSAPLSEETQAASRIPGDLESEASVAKSPGPGDNGPTPRQQATANASDHLAPLETVLQMPPPESPEAENASKPPHLQTPPYVHHFDTYTLVKQVEGGGFTEDQSITAMKGVRGLLALNLDVAKAGLVSKSDVENVSLHSLQSGQEGC